MGVPFELGPTCTGAWIGEVFGSEETMGADRDVTDPDSVTAIKGGELRGLSG